MEAAFADWLVDMAELHVRYFRDQAISLAKIAWLDVQIFWQDVKIFWYS